MSRNHLAIDIRRGILMIAKTLSRRSKGQPDSVAADLAAILEAAAWGISQRYGATDDRTKRGR